MECAFAHSTCTFCLRCLLNARTRIPFLSVCLGLTATDCDRLSTAESVQMVWCNGAQQLLVQTVCASAERAVECMWQVPVRFQFALATCTAESGAGVPLCGSTCAPPPGPVQTAPSLVRAAPAVYSDPFWGSSNKTLVKCLYDRLRFCCSMFSFACLF